METMGDVLTFTVKTQQEPEVMHENIEIMMCSHCESPGFFLATDGRLFCVNCRSQVDAEWGAKIEQPVA